MFAAANGVSLSVKNSVFNDPASLLIFLLNPRVQEEDEQ